MFMVIQKCGFSPSPEGLSYGQKSPRWETRAARNKQ
ncbi:hypothetical protein EL79_5225 [Escherichia coli]|nr:hypothetical protein EL79_5225 [Escherichia coli]